MTFATAVTRGCGRRVVGGIYAETSNSPNGKPVEHFLIDPPVPLEMDVAPQGISWIQRDGVWHGVDWIGENHYPNIADFIEEVRRFGLSRRIPINEDFGRLTADSRLLLVHARAIILNRKKYRQPKGAPYHCPKHITDHEKGNIKQMCAGMWWEDIEGGEPDPETGAVIVKMPSFTYAAKATLEGVEPEYEPAFFASFPISRLAVVAAPDDPKRVELAMEAAGKATGIPVHVVDE